MPTYLMLLAARRSEDQLDAGDIGFSAVMAAFLAISFIADQQQWSRYNDRVLEIFSLIKSQRLPERKTEVSENGQGSDSISSRRP